MTVMEEPKTRLLLLLPLLLLGCLLRPSEGSLVFSRVNFTATSSSIRAEWAILPNVSSALLVRAEHTLVSVGGCRSVTSAQTNFSSIVQALQGEVTLQALPWRGYQVALMAFSPDPGSDLSQRVERPLSTLPAAPTGAVTNLTLAHQTATQATVTWDDVTCEERNGPFQRYEALVSFTSGDPSRGLLVLTTSLVIDDLPSDATVAVRIRYVNERGAGPYSGALRFQPLRVPGPVTLASPVTSSTGVRLEVTSPGSGSGTAVERFQVRYSTSSSSLPAQDSQTATLPANSSSLALSGLSPFQVYFLQVRAGNAAGWGNWSDVMQVTTQPAPPSAPRGLSGSLANSSCVNYTWSQPQPSNGVIQQYRVTFQQGESGETTSPVTQRLLPASITSFVVCGLGPGMTFTFTVAASTSAGFGPAASLTLRTKGVTSAAESASTGLIVGVTVGVIALLLLLLLLALLLVMRHRRHKPPPTLEMPILQTTKEILPPPLPEVESEKWWSRTTNLHQERGLMRKKDVPPAGKAQVNGHIVGSDSGKRFVTFQDEFQNLPAGLLASVSEGRSSRNRCRNRFPELLPYNNTRVPLRPDTSSSNTYFNASFLTGFQQKANYIAAQTPFDTETALDFWRLIYQHGVVTVVDLAKKHGGSGKSVKYLPDRDSPSLSFGTLDVTLADQEVFANHVITTVNLMSVGSGSHRTVTIFRFTGWPDQGVPDDPIPLLGMRRKVLQQQRRSDTPPTLVHCGTGMGRSAAYIALDALIHKYRQHELISVYNFVLGMRKERPYMVRTFQQYVFIYDAIFEELHAGDTIVGFDLKEKFDLLAQKNPKTGRSFLRQQFRLLSRCHVPAPLHSFGAALLPANKHKNRYSDVIPRDRHRPVLSTPEDPRWGTDYINAVFLDGPRRKRQFIVTQCPLETTTGDFWRLVHEYRVSTVVLMEGVPRDDQAWTQYWPDVGVAVYGSLEVEAVSVQQLDYVSVRDFRLRSTVDPQKSAQRVRHFQFLGWTEPPLTPVSRKLLLDLLDLVQDWLLSSGRGKAPVTVLCQDGATASGLLVAVWSLCQAMLDHKEVDLYHSLRQLAKRRPQIVSTMDQYKFCYKALWDYINLRMRGGLMAETLGQTHSDVI